GRVERAWRWCRRNPLLANLAAVLVLALFGGTRFLTYGVVQAGGRTEANRLRDLAEGERLKADEQRTLADQQRTHAEQQESVVRHLFYYSNIHAAEQAWQDANLPRMDELLEETTPPHTNN